MRQMEIVIKIPEEKYNEAQERLKRGYTLGSLDMAILSGTVLPKGHGALKDADKLAVAIAMLRNKCNNYYGNEYKQALFQAYDISVDEIIDAPTIIEADEEAENEEDVSIR